MARHRRSRPASPQPFVDALADEQTLVIAAAGRADRGCASNDELASLGDALFGDAVVRRFVASVRVRGVQRTLAQRGPAPVLHVGERDRCAARAPARQQRRPRERRFASRVGGCYTSRPWRLPSTSSASSIRTAKLPVVRGMSFSLAPGVDRMPARAVGMRQDDGAALPRRLRGDRRRIDRARWPRRVANGLHDAARGARRRHGVPGLRAVSAPQRLRKRRVRTAQRRRPAARQARRRRCSSWSACGMRRAPGRTSFRAASSSAWRSRARSRRNRS